MGARRSRASFALIRMLLRQLSLLQSSKPLYCICIDEPIDSNTHNNGVETVNRRAKPLAEPIAAVDNDVDNSLISFASFSCIFRSFIRYNFF